jgi:hypothetical protein
MIDNFSFLSDFKQPILDLEANREPLWGKMTSRHMVEHLVFSVRLSNGKIAGAAAYESEKIPALKRFLNSDKPMPRHFVNPVIGKKLKPLQFRSLDDARKALFSEIEDFYSFFEKNPDAKPVNPTFGPLSFEEWMQFHKKHFTHHLSQFGLI